MTLYAYIFGLYAILSILIGAIGHTIFKNQQELANKLDEIEKQIKNHELHK